MSLLKLIVLMLVVAMPLYVAAQEATPASVQVTEASTDIDGDGLFENDACPLDVGPPSADPKTNGCTSRSLAKEWIKGIIVKAAPPGRPTYIEHAKETKEDALERYDGIARSLVAVVYDPDTKPLFSGSSGRSRTASILLGVMFWETGFRRDVDLGEGKLSRGDQGKSWCLMQLNIGSNRTASWNVVKKRFALPADPADQVREGFTGPELVLDRTVCISEGYKALKGSFGACRKLPLEHRLASYASGSCDKGWQKSSERIGSGIRWFARTRADRVFKDADVVAEIAAQKTQGTPKKEPQPEVRFLAQSE